MRRNFKRFAFAVTPAFVLLISAETVCRLKFFFMHDHDWNYLTMPLRVGTFHATYHFLPEHPPAPVVIHDRKPSTSSAAADPAGPPKPAIDHGNQQAAEEVRAHPPKRAEGSESHEAHGSTPSAQPSAAVPATRSSNPTEVDRISEPQRAERPVAAVTSGAKQMVFNWPKPCVDRQVLSDRVGRLLPFTWDDNCFRGDRVGFEKRVGETRVFVLGGSTVEENQPDEEMWTARLKASLQRPSVTVVNAGQAALGSAGILSAYTNKVREFKPDIVLYYEGWNEQIEYSQWNQIDRKIGAITNRIHQWLFYRGSALYTYLVEKFAFSTTEAAKFWKIDVPRLRGNLKELIDYVHNDGAELVFVTQVVQFPRMWNGIDTFNPDAVENVLDRLARDHTYRYNTYEISALNQRLAVFRSLEICQTEGIPVVNLLDEVESVGEPARAALFVDMGHLTWKGDELVGGLTAAKLGPIIDRVRAASR